MRNRSENQIELVMIRHGATPSNQEHRYLGRSDESLSMEGKQALQEEKNNYPSIDCLFISPMKRCAETAGILYPTREVNVITEWVEMDFGDFEGKNYLELQDNEYYQKWIDSNGILPFPNGESREEFTERCTQGFYKMIEKLSVESPVTAGLILHGGTIMALLSAFGGGEYFDYQVANGQGYRCVLEEKSGQLRMTDIEKMVITV